MPGPNFLRIDEAANHVDIQGSPYRRRRQRWIEQNPVDIFVGDVRVPFRTPGSAQVPHVKIMKIHGNAVVLRLEGKLLNEMQWHAV